MRNYSDEKKTQLEIFCNKCGRRIPMKKDIPMEEVFHAEKRWGYFSRQDGKKQSWDLCESCYDAFVRNFKLPPSEEEITEILS